MRLSTGQCGVVARKNGDRASWREVLYIRPGLTSWWVREDLTAVHSPESFATVTYLEQPVLGIMTLSTTRAHQEAAPLRSMSVVLLGDCKAYPATAGDQIHPKVMDLRPILGQLGSMALSLFHGHAESGKATDQANQAYINECRTRTTSTANHRKPEPGPMGR